VSGSFRGLTVEAFLRSELRIIRRRRRMIVRREDNDDTEDTEPDIVCFFVIPIHKMTFSFRVHRIRPFQLRRATRRQQQRQDDQFLFYLQWRAQYHYPPADADNNDDQSSSSAAIDVEFEMDDDFVTVEWLALYTTASDGNILSKDEILARFIGDLTTFKDPPIWNVDDDGDWFRVAEEEEENDDHRRVWNQIMTTTTTNHHPLLADEYRNRGVTVHPIQVSFRWIQNQVVKGLRHPSLGNERVVP
jgi:hypothetical protein